MACKGEKRKKGKASKRRDHLILVLKEEEEFTRQKSLYGKERAGITQGDSRGKKIMGWTRGVLMPTVAVPIQPDRGCIVSNANT